jgi:putative phage-type endonuclease
MGKGYKSLGQLWDEKMIGKETVKSAAMQRGNNLEEEARRTASQLYSMSFKPECFESDEHPWMAASLDGYDSVSKTILEVKTTNPDRFRHVQAGFRPEGWAWQVQHQMAVTGSQKALIFVYNETEWVGYYVERDEVAISVLIEKEEAFRASMLSWERPQDPLPERTEPLIKELARRLAVIRELIKHNQEVEKDYRAELIQLAGESDGFTCEGLSVRKSWVRGRVDYDAIPALEGVDVDVYRTPGREQWTIR